MRSITSQKETKWLAEDSWSLTHSIPLVSVHVKWFMFISSYFILSIPQTYQTSCSQGSIIGWMVRISWCCQQEDGSRVVPQRASLPSPALSDLVYLNESYCKFLVAGEWWCRYFRHPLRRPWNTTSSSKRYSIACWHIPNIIVQYCGIQLQMNHPSSNVIQLTIGGWFSYVLLISLIPFDFWEPNEEDISPSAMRKNSWTVSVAKANLGDHTWEIVVVAMAKTINKLQVWQLWQDTSSHRATCVSFGVLSLVGESPATTN